MSDLLQNVKPQIRHLQKEKHTHTHQGEDRGMREKENMGEHKIQMETGQRKKESYKSGPSIVKGET